MCAFVKLECFSFLQIYSELLDLHGVVEEQEDGLGLAVLGVGESEGSLGVTALTGEDLHLVELGNDELGQIGGALLEVSDTVLLAVFIEVRHDSLEESLDNGDDILLGERNLLELVSLDNVDDGLSLSCIFLLIISYRCEMVR